jgi:hypothetical protein
MTGSEQIDAIIAHIKSQMPNASVNPVDVPKSKGSVDDVAGYMKKEFQTNADLGFATGDGQKILDGIRIAVDAIKIAVEKIEPKLPTAALA